MGRRLFTLFIFGLFAYVAWPLVVPVAMGGVLAVLFFPALDLSERRWKVPTRLSAAILTLLITFIVLLPTVFLIFFVAKNGLVEVRNIQLFSANPQGGGFWENLVNLPGVRSLIERITHWFPVSVDELAAATQDFAKGTAIRIADFLGQLVTRLPGMFMALTIVVISIYFFLADGRRLIHYLRRNSFYNPQQTDRLLEALGGMCRSVILASVISGVVQAILEMLACLAVSVPNVALVGFLVFLASFVPLVGSAPVTLAVALQQLFSGHTHAGVFLLVMVAVVAVVDNAIRPVVLRGHGNLHPLLGFVAAFGGLQTIGFLGVFLGPILAGLFVVVVQIVLQGDVKAPSTT